MIIGIDGNEANVTSPVGVSVYTRALLERFRAQSTPQLQFEVYLRSSPLDALPHETENFRYILIRPSFLWSRVAAPYYFATHKHPDVLFCPAHYMPPFHSIPTVVTIHDLAYKLFPTEFNRDDLYKLEHWTRQSINAARRIITVSNHTKHDLISYYPSAATKTETVYNGFTPPSPADHVPLPPKFSVSKKKYLLSVATFQPRKNTIALVRAFETFRSSHPEFKLLLIGKKGWMYDNIFEAVQRSPAHEGVKIWTEPLTRAELNSCYQDAYATVLPSLYEGFGLPVLEAFSNNCDVVASSVSSLPEIGGDAALYCDPHNPKTIVEQLERLADPVVRKSLSSLRKKQLQKFSWDRCATETLHVLQTAAHEM